MTISRSIRMLVLVAVAAALAAAAAGSAQARPDPDGGLGTWSAAGHRDSADPVRLRPTGAEEHASLRAATAAGEDSRARATPRPLEVPLVAMLAPQRGFDWLSAGIGAIGTAAALALAAGAVIVRRRRGLARSITATLTMLALALAFAGLASAAKPVRFPLAQPTYVSDCGSFDVLIELEGMEWRTLFLDADGIVTRVLFTYPGGGGTVTNLDSGASISFVLTGPLHVDVTPESNLFRFVGGWLFLTNPETGEPGGLFFARGQLSLTEDASGVSDLSWRGHSVDVCASLAT